MVLQKLLHVGLGLYYGAKAGFRWPEETKRGRKTSEKTNISVTGNSKAD